MNDLPTAFGFDERASHALRALRTAAEPRLAEIAHEVAEHLERFEGALCGDGSITTHETRTSKRDAIARWLAAMLAGPHDDRYFALRAAAVEGEPWRTSTPCHLVLATAWVRRRLLELALAEPSNGAGYGPVARALDQILDIELALALDALADTRAGGRASETQATLERLQHFGLEASHALRGSLGVILSSAFLMQQHLEHGPSSSDKHFRRISDEVARADRTLARIVTHLREEVPVSEPSRTMH